MTANFTTTMTTHFKPSGFLKALVFAVIMTCAINRVQAQPEEVVTGMSNSFGVLGGARITSSASAGTVVGDVGTSPGTAITLGGTVVTGGIYPAIPPATVGETDAQTAYNQLAGFAVTPVVGTLSGQDLGGKTLAPGVYKFSSSAQLTGILTLSGQGQYVFQIGSTLTTASGSSILLTNGADASDVFFQVGSSATLGTGTAFQGTIISFASDTITTGSSVNGHVIALNGEVTLDANAITATTNLIVNDMTFDLGAARNEPVSIVTLSNGGLILGSGTSELINSGNYNLQNGTVTAILSGNGSNLNKTTNSTVTLAGLNTYTGATNVTAGTLTENVSNAIPSVSNLSVNGTTAVFNLGANQTNTVNTVSLDGNGSIIGTGNSTLTSTGGFQLMNGTVTAILAGNGIALNKTTNGTVTLSALNTYTGPTTITAGTLTDGVSNAIPGVSNLTVNGTTANFNLGANQTNTANIVTLAGNGSITGTGNSTLTSTGSFQVMNGTVTSILAGTGIALNKTTNGTVTLAGADTYTGATTISAGTLAVTNLAGSATGTGAVSVISGATLMGNGTVGNVTVNAGGIITPGNNALGNLTVSNLTLASSSITNLQFNGTANDRLTVTGTNGLTLGNGAILDIYQANTTTAFITPGTYQLIGYTGTLTGTPSNLTIGTTTNGLNFNLSSNGSFVDLTIAVAGGPGSWSATGSGNWSNTSDWTSGIVGSGAGNTAIFGTSITAPATVTLDGNQTVGGITFGNANSYTIAPGTGFLTLNNSGATSVIAVSLGNDTISAPVILTTGGLSAQVSVGTTLTVSGNIGQTATAGVTKAGLGTLILSGVNTYTGDTVITGGTLTDGVSNAIPSASNLTVNGTTAVFNLGANQNNTVNIVSLDGNGSIIGTGNSTLTSTGGFQLMNGTVSTILAGNGIALNKTTNGTVTLSALNTYTGPTNVTAGTLTDGVSNAIPSVSNLSVNGTTAVFNLGANQTNTVGTVLLDGNGSIIGTGNSTLTSTGGFQMLNGTVTTILAGNGIALNKTTNGTVTLAGANTYTGATTVSAGTLVLSPTGSLAPTDVVNVATGAVLTIDQNSTIATLNSNGTINGNSTLTATTYNLNNSTLVNTSLGNGTVISNGNVVVNSTLAGSNDTIDTGTLTLQQPNLLSPNATVTVTNGTTLVLANGGSTILALAGNGTIDGANGILTVTDGLGTFNGTIIGALAVNGSLVSNGNLTIAFGVTDSFPDSTLVTGGTLTVNGTLISPNVTVALAGTLSGLGTITGNVINNGIVSPSDPSILTISGNFNENGTLDIEIGGTAGPGVNPNGNDEVVVGGKTIINPAGGILNLQSVNGYTSPARGATFNIISGAPGSISGHFGSITSNFTNDLLVDLPTGQVIGTGTPLGSNLATNFPGANSNELATLSHLEVAPNQFEGGDLLRLLLTNPSASTPQIFNQASPEAYAGMTDYALRATQSYLNTALTLDPLVATGKYEVFGGYNYYNGGSDSSQNQADYTLESNGGILGFRLAITPQVFLGVFGGFDSGSVKSTYLDSSDTGFVGGVYTTYDPLASHRLLGTASFTYGNYDTHGTRGTSTGSSNFSGVYSNDYLGSLDVQYVAIKDPRYSITPEINVSYGSSSVDSFTEANPTSTEALQVNGQNVDSFRAEVAVNGQYNVTSQIGLTSRFGVSHDFDNTSRDVTANVVNDPVSMSVSAPGMGATDYNLGVGAFYTPISHLRLQISYTAGFSREARISNTISVGGSYSW